MSKCALHLALFTFAIATGYVTLVAVVTNIGSDLLSANLSHVNFYILSNFGHTTFRGLVFGSCTIEKKFFIAHFFSYAQSRFCSCTMWRSILRFFKVHAFSLSLISLANFVIVIPFSWFRLLLNSIGFPKVHFSTASTNCWNFQSRQLSLFLTGPPWISCSLSSVTFTYHSHT